MLCMHILVLGLLSSVYLTSGQTLTDTKQLYSDVFANLQKNVIPSLDQSKPLDISLRFYLVTISRFVEAEETIVVVGAVEMIWTDGGISWNPASYGNKQSIPLSNNNIWTPSLTLLNSVDTLAPIDGDTKFNVNIMSNGTISSIVGGVLSAKCTTDISKFPFDSQTCILDFTTWNIFSSDITLSLVPDSPVDLGFYGRNPDWALQSCSARASTLGSYPEYKVTLTIKREPLYYSMMVVCPTILFGLLNPLVFLLPVESGERIGLSMTILLSYAIFLTLVSDVIPATSNPMCLMVILMIATIIVSGIIVFLAIENSALYHRDESRKKNILWKFIGARLPWSKHRDTITLLLKDQSTVSCSSWTELDISWKDVADGLDILCLIVSYGSIIIITAVYFIYIN